jgi:hypothetical protein
MAPPVKDVSVAEFGELLGVSSQRVYQHIQAGMPHRKRARKGTRIVPREALAWLLDRAREQAKTVDGPVRPRDRKESAEAELKELQVLEMRRVLIPLEDFESFVDSLIGGFAAVAAGRLQRFERDMVVASTPGAARLLTDQMHAALMEGAQEYATQLEAEATVLEAEEAVA